MNTLQLFCSVLLVSLVSCAHGASSLSRERAETLGATAQVSLCVLDEFMQVVSNADVEVYFSRAVREGKTVKGKSCSTGKFEASGKTTGDILVNVNVQGYYPTSEKIDLACDTSRAVENGRWLPSVIETNIVLRKIGTPVKLLTPRWSTDFLIPRGGVPMGLDLDRQDWVKPWGKGEVADFEVLYESDGKKRSEYSGAKLTLRFVRPFDGAYLRKMDMGSKLHTCHSADTNGIFRQEFLFSEERGHDRRFVRNVMGKDEYLVLRTRSKTDSEGRFVGGRYSMIVGGISFGWCHEAFGFLGFKSFVNPTFNDPNLEEINIYNTPNFRAIGGR